MSSQLLGDYDPNRVINNLNPLLRNIVKLVRHTLKILQQMVQDFKKVSDHFTTLRSKGLKTIKVIYVHPEYAACLHEVVKKYCQSWNEFCGKIIYDNVLLPFM